MSVLLTLDDISLSRGKRPILDRVSLQVARGEIVALCGLNGVGKSTLLKVAAGALQAQHGTVTLAEKAPALRLAMVGDRAIFFPRWPVGVFLSWCAELRQVTGEKSAVAEVIARCRLESVVNQPCGTLSHGYQQRVSLAQALLESPDVLLLDEPGNGLDPVQQRLLRDSLLAVKTDTAILMTHHDLSEVAVLADRLYVLHDGRCREIPLPEKNADWLWVEWENEALAATQAGTADYLRGVVTGYRVTDRQTQIHQLLACPGLRQLHDHYPVAALAAEMEDNHD